MLIGVRPQPIRGLGSFVSSKAGSGADHVRILAYLQGYKTPFSRICRALSLSVCHVTFGGQGPGLAGAIGEEQLGTTVSVPTRNRPWYYFPCILRHAGVIKKK